MDTKDMLQLEIPKSVISMLADILVFRKFSWQNAKHGKFP